MKNNKSCSCCEKHHSTVVKAMENMPADSRIDALSAFFKMMGDPTRIKMMYLMSRGEVCVQDIASALGMTKSAISHQLSGLKASGIVKSRRDGKNVFYSIDDDHVQAVLSLAMTHIQHRHTD
ncbi:MAG: winged helix-turn-helix transcriptional regulator [Ruminococcaceae bacterium]|nr:winged helix-turn-helix transcriptional regulator [Oscillospiraceae bacterium]